jgi:cyclophilin family peptidyl-prolyl cis-trans isomerase
MKLSHLILSSALALTSVATFAADYLTLQLKDGPVVIELDPSIAPQNVARIEALAQAGKYNDVAFHRVMDGFMAQTGDVQFGNLNAGFNPMRVGTGGSDAPDLPAEFSNTPFERGTVGMARSANPDSANSQFFIMFAPGYFLNGQYTVVGKVVSGMEQVDKIKRGVGDSGAVTNPDRIVRATVKKR